VAIAGKRLKLNHLIIIVFVVVIIIISSSSSSSSSSIIFNINIIIMFVISISLSKVLHYSNSLLANIFFRVIRIITNFINIILQII